jgi:myo-inositol-1(or 4)-monophosphatase
MHPTLDFLIEMASQAGQILLDFDRKNLDANHKSRTDLVTGADHASEGHLIHIIQQAFPGHAINAEESGEWTGETAHKWYLDPLDGTLNYAHGIPFYCVSIGYAYQDQMALGVIYDPIRKEYFCAERGAGATLNGKAIQVADEEDLLECMLGTGFPHDAWGTHDDNMDNFFRFNQNAQAVRRLGSAALDIAYVAAGRLNGFWSVEIHQWDVAAAGLMVQEAGGLITNVYGDPDYMQKPVTIVAANPSIHPKMLATLAEARQGAS